MYLYQLAILSVLFMKAAIGVDSFYQLSSKTLSGKPLNFSNYKGKVVLVVNTASKCGFTPQYKGLQTLHEKYGAKGLAVVGFPSNDFGAQEPGSNASIQKFCKLNYGVSFDMAQKVKVTGKEKDAVYQFLTQKAPETGEVKWNFEKFLVNQKGQVVARYRSNVAPLDPSVTKKIEGLLSNKL